MTTNEVWGNVIPPVVAVAVPFITKGVIKKASGATAGHISRAIEGSAFVEGDDGVKRPKEAQDAIDALEVVLNEIAIEHFNDAGESRDPAMTKTMVPKLRGALYRYFGSRKTGIPKSVREAIVGKGATATLNALGAGAVAGVIGDALADSL